MKKSLCESLVQFYPRISEYEELRSTFVASCVFNNFLCYTTIMLNIVTIHAMRKTSSLPKTLKTLLLSLAVSDVGVGLLGQPFHTSILTKWIQQNNPSCSTYMAFTTVTTFFTVASFLGVVAVSVDRFLAIHLHLRYQELVTHKRVVAVVILVWASSVFLPLVWWSVPFNIFYLTVFIGGVVGLALATLVYIRIYFIVRRHKNQIQALQVQQAAQTGEMSNLASVMKSAVGIFYVYLLLLLCYLPKLISLAVFEIYGPSTAWKRLSLFSSTLIYLNSSLNPVIYCWKMGHIRHAIMNILRNLSRFRNSTSQ